MDYELNRTIEGIFINGIKINDLIFSNEDSDYRVVKREQIIDDLIHWISETKSNSDRELMKDDLKYLINQNNEFIFSSILTNEYVLKSTNEDLFNEICEELLKLNKNILKINKY